MGYGEHVTATVGTTNVEDANVVPKSSKVPLLLPFQLGPFKLQHRYYQTSARISTAVDHISTTLPTMFRNILRRIVFEVRED